MLTDKRAFIKQALEMIWIFALIIFMVIVAIAFFVKFCEFVEVSNAVKAERRIPAVISDITKQVSNDPTHQQTMESLNNLGRMANECFDELIECRQRLSDCVCAPKE